MVGSIDPRCETVRGTHWPNQVVWLFGTRVAGAILASGSKQPHQQAGHMDASDPISPQNLLCQGAVHIWVPAFAGTTPITNSRGNVCDSPVHPRPHPAEQDRLSDG